MLYDYDYMSTAFLQEGFRINPGNPWHPKTKTTAGFRWNGSIYTCVAAKSLNLGHFVGLGVFSGERWGSYDRSEWGEIAKNNLYITSVK